MLVLGIDTSTRVGGVGLYDSVKGLLGEENLVLEQTHHSQRLMPAVEHLLEACGVKITDIDGFAVTVGPGSFTGSRIGVTAAKTLAQVANRLVVGVSTIEATAYNLLLAEGVLCPIFDARNRRVYTACFKRAINEGTVSNQSIRLNRLTEDDALSIDQLLDALKQLNECVYFAGDAVEIYRQVLVQELGEKAIFPPATFLWPRGGVIAELGAQAFNRGERADLFLLTPNYLKPAEAEVNWQKKHGSR